MDLTTLTAFAAALLSLALAAAAFLRKPGTFVSRTFAAGMTLLAAERFAAGIAAHALMPPQIAAWQNWRLLAMSFLPGVWLLFSLAYARGNAREFLARWKIPLTIAFLAPVSIALLFHGELIISIEESADYSWKAGLGLPALFLYVLVLLSTVVILMNLERTFQASVGTMRWRIKFMLLGVGVLFVARAYSSSQILLFRAVVPGLDAINSAGILVAGALILFSLRRAGYFEVNVYPSQSILQNSLTIVLIGVYLLVVGLFARAVTLLGGDAALPIKAFGVLAALVLLTIVLLSERVRQITRRFVSRHFQRPLYDYRTVWRAFTNTTASLVRQTDFCRAVVILVSDVFQALSVTVWIVNRDKQQLAFGASTSITEAAGENLQPETAAAAEVIRALRNRTGPVDIDASPESWSHVLRRSSPGEFRKGGNRFCVPLIAGGDLLGVLVLGDRVGGTRFSVQDFDLLKCIADQTAAGLLNIELSQRLLQSREMEAFQTMSAFFVHDLKNTASTLSLMLQNLPVHFNDPAFREDALRGVARTVDHINNLIRRLTLLRQELVVKPVESDLNAVVSQTLESLGAASDAQLSADLGALPRFSFDPEQVQKVITNLVLNAREAVDGQGSVRIATRQHDAWAVLSVTDNGSGMTREFLTRSLFRPFQTTKEKGIGIGMFQSKMIVEAHKGRIEVESEPGKGTEFRMFLPCTTNP